MFTISKRFTFDAAHQLSHLHNPEWPADDPRQHKCSRKHGHTYTVEVILQAEDLDPNGFVVDYGELAPLKEHIDQAFDHRDLNTVLPFFTTAENLARYFYAWCKGHWPATAAVRVSETPGTWAEYRPDPWPRFIITRTEMLNTDSAVNPRNIAQDVLRALGTHIKLGG